MIPRDSVPQGAVSADARVVASVIVSLDANQPAPEFGDSGFSGGVVHVTLTQPTTNNVDDLDLFIDRRIALQKFLDRLTGTIGAPPPAEPEPRPVTGRSYSSAYSGAYS